MLMTATSGCGVPAVRPHCRNGGRWHEWHFESVGRAHAISWHLATFKLAMTRHDGPIGVLVVDQGEKIKLSAPSRSLLGAILPP